MNASSEDASLNLLLDDDERVVEGCPRHVDGEGIFANEVAHVDIVDVSSGGDHICLRCGESNPPHLYFLVVALLTLELLPTVASFGPCAKVAP